MSENRATWWKSDWAIISLLALISFFPRLYLLLHTQTFSSDGVSYLSTALYLREPELIGEVPKRIYFILYPSLALLADLIFNNIALSGRVINLLIGTAIPPLAYLLGKRIFDPMSGFIGGIFCAINPLLVIQSAEIRGDNLFALTTLVIILYFESVDWSKPRVKNALWFGFLMGIAQLSRTNGLMYLFVVIPLWLWWVRKKRISFNAWFSKTLIPFAIVFTLIIMIPQALLAIRGAPRPSMFIYTFLDGNIVALGDRESVFFKLNLEATDYQFLDDVASSDLKSVVESLPLLPRKYVRNLGYSLMLLFGPAIAIILRLSIILMPLLFYLFYYWGDVRFPSGGKRLLLWFLPSFVLLPAINIEDLYFLPLIPLIMLFLSWLVVTAGSLGWIRKWHVWVTCVLILVISIPMAVEISTSIRKESKYVNPYLSAGQWLKENTPNDAYIMARNPEVFFHAFRRGYRMPLEDLNRTLIFMRNRKIDYIVFGPSEIKKRRELFMETYSEVFKKGKQSRLSVVHTIDTGFEAVYILKIVPENFKVESFPEVESKV